MTTTTVTRRTEYLERPRSNGLADVIDIILDKGLVIDAFVRVSLLGLELLTIDARVVVASVDTYLRFAEAVDRVVLAPGSSTTLPDIIGGSAESGARRKARGVARGAKESVKETLGVDGGGQGESGEQEGDGQESESRERGGGGGE